MTKEETHFTPEARQATLDRVLDALHTDERIAGVLVVGSGAVGFEDEYSDIDLTVVVADEANVQSVFGEWRGRVEALLPVLHRFESVRGPNVYLYGFLLDGFLELDMSFQCPTDLVARRERWRVAFDRSGQIADIMQASWEGRAPPDVKATYLGCLNSIWYYITHAVSALKRGRPWRAIYELTGIRHRAVELAGLRQRLETKHFRDVHKLPGEFFDALQSTLVSRPDEAEIMRALEAAVACFFREARGLDAMLGLGAARDLERHMRAYLSLFSVEEAD